MKPGDETDRPTPNRLGGLERNLTSLSLVVLATVYGSWAMLAGWFPGPLIERAFLQASATTGPPEFAVPRIYDRQGARVLARDQMQPGLTLVATAWEEDDWNPGLRLIDSDGTVLHAWSADPAALEEVHQARMPWRNHHLFHGVHLFPDGDVLVNLEYAGTARLDSCSEVVWSMPRGNHHSIARDDEGFFWIPATGPEIEPPTSERFPDGYPGFERDLVHDRIFRVSPDGEIVRDISVLDILFANGMQRFLAKGKEWRPNDLSHLNDVEVLSDSMAAEYPVFEAGDLLLSIRNSDLVAVVDPETLAVKWHVSEPFIQQHDPDFMGDGWIGVFDNNRDGTARGTLAGGSRIVAVQPHTDSLEVLFPTPASETFYTKIMGKWQSLENGNLLLTESDGGRVVEVDPEGRTVWDWVAPPYDSTRTVEVTEGTRYALTPDHVAQWPCSEPPGA